MPTSLSAEWGFSMLERVKTKLRNNMGNTQISNLVLLAAYPDLVRDINIIDICNKFCEKTIHTNLQKKLFGTFIEKYLSHIQVQKSTINSIYKYLIRLYRIKTKKF